MTNRSPDGKFISREAMLSAWMQTLLEWHFRDSIDATIHELKRYCEDQFRHSCRFIGNSADWFYDEPSFKMTGYPQQRYLDEGKKWLAKRDILKRAMDEIAALEKAR